MYRKIFFLPKVGIIKSIDTNHSTYNVNIQKTVGSFSNLRIQEILSSEKNDTNISIELLLAYFFFCFPFSVYNISIININR